MSAAVAMEVFADSTRSKLRAYIGQAQKEKDRKDSAMLIKKMVQFNSLVVTPIMDKIQVGGAVGCVNQCAVCCAGCLCWVMNVGWLGLRAVEGCVQCPMCCNGW